MSEFVLDHDADYGIEPDYPTPDEEACAAEKAAADLKAAVEEGMRAAIAWNRAHPIGTEVRFWPGARDGEGIESKTRSEAWVLASGCPVVSVMGRSGGMALSHVEAVAR